MKKIVLLLFFTINTLLAFGQTFEFNFDHDALLVADLDKSVQFYQEVLQLKEIKTPADNPAIRWFSLGGHHQLHLIEEKGKEIKLHLATHFSLNVNDFDGFVQFLKDKEIPFINWQGESGGISLRPDGVKQVYIQDPDGYWIEINDATY